MSALNRDSVELARSVSGRIIREIRAAATSAELGETAGLAYADGWHAAATLAGLVAADEMSEQIRARSLLDARGPDWHPRE